MVSAATRRLKIPRRVIPAVVVLCGTLIVSVHEASVAMVIIHEQCTFPADWPKVLDEVANSCRMIEVATGIQETIYEIVFDDKENFEKLWPVLLSLKTPGAPLRLFKVQILPNLPEHSLTSNAKPAVRILGPADGVNIAPSEAGNEPRYVEQLLEEGKALRSSPPWPAGIVSANCELPEYVQSVVEEDGRMTWVPGDRNRLDRGFLCRARVDLELVADGSVIDLNRTQLPSDGPIIDRRFDPKP